MKRSAKKSETENSATPPLALATGRRTWWNGFSYQNRLSLTGFVFVLPALLYFAVFAFWPMLNALYLSFFRYDLLSPPEWVGPANYADLASSATFLNSLWLTGIYALGYLGPVLVLSLGLGMLLNLPIRFRTFFRTVYFAPIVMPLVVLSVIWTLLYTAMGPINIGFVQPLIGKVIPWLSMERYALPAVLIMAVWRAAGYYAVIFLVGLQNIPREYYEAARLDGAGTLARFRHITWPLLKPTTAFVVVLSFISAIRHFDAIWIMTRGGPVDATRILVVLIYETGWQFFKMGKAAAMSAILFVCVLALTVVQLRLFREEK
jgi:ABC-type sugar transport system permease subunit